MHGTDHVSLWHPWKDRPGQRHTPVLFSDLQCNGIDQTIATLAQGEYYGLVGDILNGLEVNPLLLRDKRTEAYLSRHGSIAALRIKSKRKNGFLLPSSTWGSEYPEEATCERMNYVFRRFGFEALTPASLSEKVLRSTLPDKTFIYRPSHMLRSSLLLHGKGGRIDRSKGTKRYEEAYENDINKAYLYIAGLGVPDPFVQPICFHNHEWSQFATSWQEVTMTCHRDKGIQPIQILDGSEMREPVDGELFNTWLWKGEIEDCLEAGYTLHDVRNGWGWDRKSYFLSQWADILWEKYEEEEDEIVRTIIKHMMVGLPGRFLRRPEKLTLVHRSEARDSDLPLTQDYATGASPMSEWCMRVEEDIDSAQLTPIGSYIVAECRRKLYRDSKREEQSGNQIIRVYIDSFTTTLETKLVSRGKKRGEYKVKKYEKVTIRHNRFLGRDSVTGKLVLKAPSVPLDDDRERARAIKELQQCLHVNAPP